MIDWGYRCSAWPTGSRRRGCAQRRPAIRRRPRQARGARAGHPLHQQADARRPAEAHVARAARHRGQHGRPDHPRSGKVSDECDAVFYSPGCGSERLFSQVGLATQAMLYHVGAQTVLRPDTCAAAIRRRRRATTTRVSGSPPQPRLFHRVANTLNYLDIKTVIVSCGTCMDQLQKYEFDKIFPGCRLLDIQDSDPGSRPPPAAPPMPRPAARTALCARGARKARG